MLRYTRNIILPILCFFIITTTQAQQLSADTVARLDQFLSQWGENTPGASVVISRGGKVIYERHVGMADLEHNVSVTVDTRFEAGSVSKQFAATAILMLVNDGKISLDDEVQKYIPELPVYDRPITVAQLVHHTSGLKDWGTLASLGGWSRGTRVYTNDIALKYIVRQPTLNYSPGEEYLYSNSNYTLMTHIVERVSGQSLADFTAERIFQPLGMTQTLWRTDYRAIVKRRAIGYSPLRNGEGYRMNMPFENTYGHAALLTTTHDLNRWNESWHVAKADPALLALRLQQGVLNNGETIAYAGGVRIDEYNGRRVVSHSGATAGYRAWLSYFPEEELSVVFLSNDTGAKTTATGEGLAAVFFGEKSKKPSSSSSSESSRTKYTPSDSDFGAVVGLYSSDAVDGKWRVEKRGKSLQIQIYPHSNWIRLRPVDKDVFRGSRVGTVEFARDPDGTVRGLHASVGRARNVWFDRKR